MSGLSDMIPDRTMRELLAELYPVNPGFAQELAWAMCEGMFTEAEWVGERQKTERSENHPEQMRLGEK